MRPILYILLFVSFIALVSCEEEVFNPKGEYDERYSLNCIIRSDTNLQVLTTFISYDVPGLDPYQNIKYPFIENAFIRMWQGDDVYVFKDSIEERIDTSRYKSPKRYYYLDNFIAKEKAVLEIEALLPNGRRLKAITRIPEETKKDFNSSDKQIPVERKDNMTLAWNSPDPEAVFLPMVELFYKQNINGQWFRKKKEIPLEYVVSNGDETAVYPTPSRDFNLHIPISVIDRIMNEISEGDDKKSNYEIYTIITTLYTFDKNLSGYFSSVAKIDDSFSVSLDEMDFSNIDGGFGIFGAYYTSRMVTFIDKEYVATFGYRYGLDN